MKQVGTIVGIIGDLAEVDVVRMSACEGCHKSAEGCSVCSIMGGNSVHRVQAINSVGAKEGDKVELQAKTQTVLGYAFLVFVLPIFAAGLAYYLSSLFTQGAYCYLFALLGMLAVFAILRIVNGRAKERPDVEIVKVINNMGGDEGDTRSCE